MHGEPSEVAANPGSEKTTTWFLVPNWVFFPVSCVMTDEEVLLVDSLAQAQVAQAGPLNFVLLLAEKFRLPPPLRVQTQGLPEVGLDTTQLKQRFVVSDLWSTISHALHLQVKPRRLTVTSSSRPPSSPPVFSLCSRGADSAPCVTSCRPPSPSGGSPAELVQAAGGRKPLLRGQRSHLASP